MSSKATVIAPSNIAFVKYWGTRDVEKTLPYNASISMTLSSCVSRCTVEYLPEEHAFLLEDGISVGAVLELTPVACEARPMDFLEDLHKGLFGMLSNLAEVDPEVGLRLFPIEAEGATFAALARLPHPAVPPERERPGGAVVRGAAAD